MTEGRFEGVEGVEGVKIFTRANGNRRASRAAVVISHRLSAHGGLYEWAAAAIPALPNHKP
jgi:alpha-beta hydrolase superfamily lysophospholipase